MKNVWAASLKVTAVSLLAVSLAACGGGAKPAASGAENGKSTAQPAASKYPEKAVSLIAPSGAGGGWDMTARTIAKVLAETKALDKPVTVENKPGGGGTVFMAEYATKDVKDNYKLFVSSPPILINNLKKEGNTPFGYKDTTPLAQLTKDYGAIAVAAGSKYNDLKSLLDDMKADPSKLTVAGGSAPGSMDHLVSILPAFKYGIDPKKVKYVSYDGGGEAITALLGGNADVLGTDASSLDQYLKAGKIKVLAVAAPQRLGGGMKDVPTMKEQGVDAEFLIWRGIFGPKEMSADARKFWDEAINKMVESEQWKKEMQANNWETEYKKADDFKTYLTAQEAQVKDILTALGMQK
ncbi:tripartite tricarboxylate transporter substrate binding protein [Paenibacillus doosanensis]|uniref:Tripartite tricarboxylate transporter family receptor n=1 Tax=Paenibacillus konkukensis TaxID=2020716 RepID=A0ABY4RKC9_9BACL|nr:MULTISPECIES: tripartite tricarboxylate transporter substrate binding protein [Paenibacillus]MCS7462672.1 tripartite tricarboxylate transporter substrate binding protein [Paenibacillus doosanensis]UQZ82285.1 Tripartite tricarboxylate transporter family receptor [Paenibacillus konkukensis]